MAITATCPACRRDIEIELPNVDAPIKRMRVICDFCGHQATLPKFQSAWLEVHKPARIEAPVAVSAPAAAPPAPTPIQVTRVSPPVARPAPAPLPVEVRTVVVTERTAKKWKLGMVLSVLAIIASLLAYLNSSTDEGRGIAGAILGVSLLSLLIIKFLAWWNHG